MKLTVDELNILLTLNGNQRIEHLEDEIFSNSNIDIILIYLNKLLHGVYRDTVIAIKESKIKESEVPWAIYQLAHVFNIGRWFTAEKCFHRFVDSCWWAIYVEEYINGNPTEK